MTARDALESDALRSFAVFAEHANFTRAAEVLRISQPSLHAKIARLSAALGIALYEREGRGLVLTPAGRRLAALAADTARQVDGFLDDLRSAERAVTVAAGRGAVRWVVAEGIRRLASRRHLSLLVAEAGTAADAVLSGRADIAVLAFDPPSRALRSVLIATYPQVLVLPVGHPLAGRERLLLAELDGCSLIVPPQHRPHRRSLERALAEAGAAWSVGTEVDGWDLMVHFTGLGLGLAVVNGCVLPPPGLVTVPLPELPAVRYWAAWRPARQALVDGVLDLLVDR